MNQTTVHVLLLEDNPADAAIVLDALDRSMEEKYVLTQAVRLGEAVAKLQIETFDVVISDLLLPDSTGLGTLTKLRHAAPRTPILVCTGTTDQETGAEAVRRGAQDYLVKGRITSRYLRRAVRYAMDRKGIENQLEDLNETIEGRIAERTAELEKSLSALQDQYRSHRAAAESLRKGERQAIERLLAGVEQLLQGHTDQWHHQLEGIRDDLHQLAEANRLGLEMWGGEEPRVGEVPSEEDFRQAITRVNEFLDRAHAGPASELHPGAPPTGRRQR